MTSLNLGFVGNCSFGALIDRRARVVWCCLPRFDGDPVFASLLNGPQDDPASHTCAVELTDTVDSDQEYVANTAVLRTRLHGKSGSIEVLDFAPRFHWRDRIFRPQTLVRRIRPLGGMPRIRLRVRPMFAYGAVAPTVTAGSNHIRYVGPDFVLRLTTNAAIDYVLDETVFNLEDETVLVLGPDETLSDSVQETARSFMDRTVAYWQGWTHRLALPVDWQEAVSRAAVTLKLCTYEPTGAIVAAVTTSIPEAANSGRNWDYRHCWLRDAFFVVRALNSLAAVRTMETYAQWLMNVIADAEGGHLQPVFGVGLEKTLTERTAPALSGYRGMGPVRIGNQAHEHFQHDVYGNVILGTVQTFFDTRLHVRAGLTQFRRLEAAGERAYALHDQPDAGMWELRSRAHVHTSSSLMCWAACDRLAKIATHLGDAEAAAKWAPRAGTIKATILDRAWSQKRKAFVDSFDGETLDASVLLMAEVGFIDPTDPRFVSTLEAIETTLADGAHVRRYEAADDYGQPETAFNICAFWRVDALARTGRREEAREHFETLLACRNHVGLISEDVDPATGELWGNFPQTFSMVGIINGAMRLSRSWETVV